MYIIDCDYPAEAYSHSVAAHSGTEVQYKMEQIIKNGIS